MNRTRLLQLAAVVATTVGCAGSAPEGEDVESAEGAINPDGFRGTFILEPKDTEPVTPYIRRVTYIVFGADRRYYAELAVCDDTNLKYVHAKSPNQQPFLDCRRITSVGRYDFSHSLWNKMTLKPDGDATELGFEIVGGGWKEGFNAQFIGQSYNWPTFRLTRQAPGYCKAHPRAPNPAFDCKIKKPSVSDWSCVANRCASPSGSAPPEY